MTQSGRGALLCVLISDMTMSSDCDNGSVIMQDSCIIHYHYYGSNSEA